MLIIISQFLTVLYSYFYETDNSYKKYVVFIPLIASIFLTIDSKFNPFNKGFLLFDTFVNIDSEI
jgi:hypothetical protein